MSKRSAELVTESAAATQRPVRNLSACVKVEKDNKADHVVGVEHPSQTMQARSNHQPQQNEPASSAASMEEPTLLNTAGSTPMRQQSKRQVQLTKEECTTSDPTMIYHSTTEAEEALKEEVLQNVTLKFGTCEISS